MTSDIRTILDFVLAERLRDICERRGVAAGGSREEQRERVVKSLAGDVRELLPLLMRAELVEFLATRDLGGRFAFVSRASRWELERLLTMLCAGDPHATHPQPLGADSPVRFERKPVRSMPAAPPPAMRPKEAAPVSEKVFRSRVQRQRGLIYYVKNGDVWAAPTRRGGSKRAPQCVHESGVAMDHVTYLYYVDGDGDIARKRRDRAPLGAAAPIDNVTDPVRVFIGYARSDRRFLTELCAALSPLESSGEVSLFFDGRIDPGVVWEPVLKAKVQTAEIAVLLLSNDFLGSKYCNEVEWPLIRERHRRGECEIAPVLIRQCYFPRAPIAAFNLIRPNNQAVDDHPKHDQAWMEVTHALVGMIDRVLAKRR